MLFRSIDRDYVKGTVLRYERTVRYLEEMLQSQYNLKDIPLKELNHEFVLNFEHFVKVQKGCAQNAAVKYLKNLKKITRLALVNKWITDDPFSEIRFHQTQSNRDFLTEEELNAIINKKFDIPRLETIRDIFVFCVFTFVALIKPILIINELQTYNRGIGNDLETICLHHFA